MSEPRDPQEKGASGASGRGVREARHPAASAGRSGSASSIGKELGGDLDFDPEALLGSLMADEPDEKPVSGEPEAPPPPPTPDEEVAAQAPEKEALTEQAPIEEEIEVEAPKSGGLTEEDRVTLAISEAEARAAEASARALRAPRNLAADADISSDELAQADAIDALVEEALSSDEPAQPVSPPLGIPRPAGPAATAKPPPVNPPGLGARQPFPIAHSPPVPPAVPVPLPPDRFDLEESGTGEELDDLKDAVEDDEEGAMVGADGQFLPEPKKVAKKEPEPEAAALEPPPSFQAELEDERPAAAHLAEHDALDDFIRRAEWMQEQAAQMVEHHAKAHAWLIASELWALAGDTHHAREAAQQAQLASSSTALVARQHRWMAAVEEDWKAAVAALEFETRASPTPEARAHAAYLSAEIHRIKLDDLPNSRRKLELALRAKSDDPRAYLSKFAEELSQSTAAPAVHWPQLPEFEALADGAQIVDQLRQGVKPGERPLSPAAAFAQAQRELAVGNGYQAAATLVELARSEDIAVPALWLTAALCAPAADARPYAVQVLRALLARDAGPLARRALAARALEQADSEALEAALAPSDSDTEEDLGFSSADRVALAALTGSDMSQMTDALTELDASKELSALASAARSAAGLALQPDTVTPGNERSRTEVDLGRAVAASRGVTEDAALEALRVAAEAYTIAHPGHALSRTVTLEFAVRGQDAAKIAEELSEWPNPDKSAQGERDRLLASALAHELGADRPAAKRQLAAAFATDSSNAASVRALMEDALPEASSDLLVALAETCSDGSQGALLFIEAALRRGTAQPEAFEELLERAAGMDPRLPFASRLGELLARERGEVGDLLKWLRARREASTDDVQRALDSIREALLVAESDMELSASLLRDAVKARPNDIALRELHERLATGSAVERGGWREELAVQAQGQTRARLLLEAALEYARGDDLEAAARVIALAAEMGAGDLARAMWARLGTRGPAAAELAEELFQKAQAETDANTQRDLYEQLGELDRARGETSSAILWQKAILERAPSYLPALRRLEHAYLREGRTDELEPIAHTLASLLDPNEANAHAWLSARLRTKNADATGAAEMAALAAKLDPPALWALRALSVQAKDDETILDACQKLGGLVSQAREAGSLALRAAQAAVRLRRFEEAKPLLERAVEALPEHVLASHLQAAVLEALGEPAGAAEALERFANLSGVQAHRAEAWWRAAKLWQNRARDLQRAEHAFEQALASDPARTDAFEELRRVYTERGEGAKLADLLERILEETSDPAERLRLEITRARALTQASKLDLAKQALASVLEREPEHLEALDALADLCAAEGDWPGAEDAWIRLARHVQAPEEQARIYKKLGVLYDESLPHAERAELAYLEVLKRHPEDTDTVQKLVRVYGRLGKPEKAIELQNDLLNRATTNEQKRDYTIGLALVYEQVIGDRRKAEQTLERARRTWPNDGPTLRASAEFYRRGGDERALGTLIERAQGEARRALSTGRFEPSFFESLATTAELRGSSDAADLARATLAAIQGRKSELAGAGHRAGAAELDDLLAPDLLSPPLRALLKKTGDALDLAYPSDLRALRTSPVEEDSPLGESLRNLGTAFGLKIEAHVTPTLGSVCLAANASPARIVIGKALADSKDETAKTFVLIRSLKAIQSNAAAFSRTAPIELWPVLAAYLSLFSPSWTPQGVDQKKMSQAQERLKPHLGSVDSEASALAQEVIGGIGNRASQLGTAIHQWGNRTALLAIGDPNAAFRGICLASGHGTEPPSDAQERLKWVVRSAEARDLSVFSVSDAYAEVRRRLGLGRSES